MNLTYYTTIKAWILSMLPMRNNMLDIATYFHIARENDFNLWTEDLTVEQAF